MKNLFVAAVIVCFSPGVMAADDAAIGKGKVATHAGCHGVNGKAMVLTYPSLAGQNAAYLGGALKANKTHEREGYQAAIMYVMAAMLSDQSSADISAFCASEE